VRSIRNNPDEMMAALYLQVSIISQALIFVTRSRSWSFVERPGLLLLGAFMIAQLVNLLLSLMILRSLVDDHMHFSNTLDDHILVPHFFCTTKIKCTLHL